MILVVDHPRREALAEQGTAAPPTGVVLAGVEALVRLGRARDVLDPALQDRVVVRSEQAVGVPPEVEAPQRGAEEPKEQKAVAVVVKEERPVDAVRGYVEVPVRKRRAPDPRHAPNVRREPRRNAAAREFCSSFATLL